MSNVIESFRTVADDGQEFVIERHEEYAYAAPRRASPSSKSIVRHYMTDDGLDVSPKGGGLYDILALGITVRRIKD